MNGYGDKYDILHRKNYIKRTLKLGQKAPNLKKKPQVRLKRDIVYIPPNMST